MTQRLLVISIEQVQDGRHSKVRRNVLLEQFDALPEDQKKNGFLILVEQLRNELDTGKAS